MVVLFVIGELFVAVLFAVIAWLYWTDAEVFRGRNLAAIERMPKLLRLFCFPSLVRSRFGLWQVRSIAVAAALMSTILVIAAVAALVRH